MPCPYVIMHGSTQFPYVIPGVTQHGLWRLFLREYCCFKARIACTPHLMPLGFQRLTLRAKEVKRNAP